jgi:hypothetical protein
MRNTLRSIRHMALIAATLVGLVDTQAAQPNALA